jgi:sigma-54-dependent transcriptional regulator
MRDTPLLQAPDVAEQLVQWLMRLGLDSDRASMPGNLAHATAQLSQCSLSQVYLSDEAGHGLFLAAEHRPQAGPWEIGAGAEVDQQGQQLLRFALEHKRPLSLCGLQDSMYDTAFIPSGLVPWQSLLCVPLIHHHLPVKGMLLCVTERALDLQPYATPLGQLGGFALRQRALLQEPGRPAAARQALGSAVRPAGLGLIGNSAAMDDTCRLIGKVLDSTYTVLLRGETGTGKEVVARAIHAMGPRRSKAFVVQNCAAFPEGLLESELFGYRKGAFTGADRDRPGLFDAADGGTLLLDEIGDMPLSLQAKLLRVLQEGEIRPLGASTAHKVDVRIVAATHRDLRAMVAQGSFREDLYYRLAQFPIELPALRQREGDIRELARHFAGKACATQGRSPVSWSNQALDQLSCHSFPGNVRELKCLVERAVLMCDEGVILPQHLMLPLASPAQATDATLRQRLERVERGLLIDCLHKNRGNRTRTARELGVARRTLLYRLARLNIPFGDVKEGC